MKIPFIAASCLLHVVLSTSNIDAQQQTNDQPPNGLLQQDLSQTAAAKKVGYRMTGWRTVHGDGTKATTDLVSTLKKIGCEVRKEDHGGHVDIAFRCQNWRSISCQNDEQSAQWQQWLANNEFETVVLNPPPTTKLPTVKIRMAGWKTVHARSVEQAQSMKGIFELVGCEAVINKHGDHIDLKYRCTDWSTIGLANSQAAHIWQDWLSKSGFETRHDHATDGHDPNTGHNHQSQGHESQNHRHDDHSGHDHEHE